MGGCSPYVERGKEVTTTPHRSPNQHSEKNTGTSPEPSHTTNTISRINPKVQPRTDTGNEALGSVGFGVGKVWHADFFYLRHAVSHADLGVDAIPPPLVEQHRIVAKVDALMALCDRARLKERAVVKGIAG